MDHRTGPRPPQDRPPADTDAGSDTDVGPADGAGPVRDPGVPDRGGWGAWIVVVAAAVTLGVILVADVQLLRGARDSTFFVQYTSESGGPPVRETMTGITFWQRWGLLWWLLVPRGGLLGAAALVVVLAALQSARRPGWLVPGPLARRAGAVVGALTAAVCLSAVGLAVADASRSASPGDTYGYSSGSLLYDVGELGGQLLVGGVLAAVAAAALLWPGARALPRPEDPRPSVATGEPVAPGAVPVGAVPVGAVPVGAPETDPGPADPWATGAGPTGAGPVAPAFPRPADAALYRRPPA